VFSQEEITLLTHLQGGATNREIAESLGLTTSEVADRTRALLRMLGAENRQELRSRIAAAVGIRVVV
jgi:DNA-binding NarL/FixJ family response regulator